MYELCFKYSEDSYILIGGDLNDELHQESEGKRLTYIREFLNTFNLQFKVEGKTYVSPQGIDCTEIDYFLHNIPQCLMTKDKHILNDIPGNVSDHYPIACILKWSNKTLQKKKGTTPNTNRISWKHVDIDLYSSCVETRLKTLVHIEVDEHNMDQILTTLSHTMQEAATEASRPKKKHTAKPKLKAWSSEIQAAHKNMKHHYTVWKKAGKPQHMDNESLIQRNETKKQFRQIYRQTLANRDVVEKQKILEARSSDTKLFHRLVNSQRKKGRSFINDLHVGDNHFNEEQLVQGFEKHFAALAKESEDQIYDHTYHKQVQMEVEHITHLSSQRPVIPVTEDELQEAIQSINTGKSPDIYNITIEHIKYSLNLDSQTSLTSILMKIANNIFHTGKFPDTLKKGLLTPIYKNKGLSNVSTNYRGITVLPVLGKIVEAILRRRISPMIEEHQCHVQRGFTRNASPLNSAFIIEELYRDSKDTNSPLNLILLDAKSAFDVVDHQHLLRRLYHMGVNDVHWNLIQSFHKDGTAAVKWNNQTSDHYTIEQGVRQGGILSTDLYKTYVNPLLARLQASTYGQRIGNITCAASACADDICLAAEGNEETQLLLSMSTDFANMERYILQPTKSVHIGVNNSRRKDNKQSFSINDREIPSVASAPHLGIIRTDSLVNNQFLNVEENIKKARRAAYSLFGSGLRGHEGLNIQTLVHLYKTYITPVLLYGMELILPNNSNTEKIETFQKKLLKEMLKLPNNTANPAIYLITGLLPVEAQIQLKTLIFLHNLVSQKPNSIERQILERQYHMKPVDSRSWVVEVQRVLWKYDLPCLGEILSDVLPKPKWKTLVHRTIYSYWSQRINTSCILHKSLRFLHEDKYFPGKVHPLFGLDYSSREAERLKPKLKLATGTYILQSNRKSFNQHTVADTCQLCDTSSESADHFVLTCPVLDGVRTPILADIKRELHKIANIDFEALVLTDKTQYIINSWQQLQRYRIAPDDIREYERQCSRLIYSLDRARINMLQQVPQRRRGKQRLQPGLLGAHTRQ